MTNSPFETQTHWIDQHFEKLDYSNAEVENLVFENCKFINCNFSHMVFKNCRFTDCEWLNSNLNLARFLHSKFRDGIFEDSKLVGIDWTIPAWPNIALARPLQFYRCQLNQSTFMRLKLEEMVMIDCVAKEVDFREAQLAQSDFSGTQFTGSLFNGNDLKSANFTDTTDYTIDIEHNNIKHAKFSLPEAMNLLAGLDIELVDS